MSARLMLVEDERIVALDLKHSLEYLGYEVVGISARADDAISSAGRLQPDLILMDIHLDGSLDGTHAAQEIHRNFRLPVMFLTAYAEEKILARAEASAPYGYIIKPYELRELEAAVRMALSRRRSEIKVERTEERLRLAMDAAQIGVWEWQERTNTFLTEGHVENILGEIPESFQKSENAFLERIHLDDRPAVAAALHSGQPVNATVRMRLREGSMGWCDLHARVHSNGRGLCIVGTIRDVTARRQDEERLRQASVVFRTTAEGIVIMDANRHIISANPAFCQLCGYTLRELEGQDPDDFLHARRHSDQFYPRLAESPQGFWIGEIACRRRNGEIFPAWQHICAVRDEGEEVSHYVMALTDVSAIRQAEAQISHLAYHDALTGLGNRHKLDQRLAQEIERCQASKQQLAMLFIDLDGFKLINDSLGHLIGDQLLRTIAHRIHQNLRRSDIAIRLGGDEFILLIPEVELIDECAKLADKILRHVRHAIDLPQDRVSISASIGIAIYPRDAANADELIRAADSAMYDAKSRGRNRYSFYSPEMADRTRERLHLEQGLLHAIEHQQFVLHFQPLVRLSDGALAGFEALVRWQHPAEGLIPPDRFIPVAEDTGLIDPIGDWVLREACNKALPWFSHSKAELRLAVNLSVRQIASGTLLERITAILVETGFPPQRLEIEITESALQSIEQSQGVLYGLRALGCSIVIDDFGTGFSSLGLLKHLPIDGIKIDRSFVQNLPDDQNDLAITRAIVALAHSLGLRITAEGIETPEQKQLLRDIACTDGQGFLFGRPMDSAAVTALLTAGDPNLH